MAGPWWPTPTLRSFPLFQRVRGRDSLRSLSRWCSVRTHPRYSEDIHWKKKTVLIIIKNKHKKNFLSLFFIGSSLCDGNCPWRRQLPAWLFGLLLLQVSSSSGQNGNIGEEGHRDDNHGSFLLSGRSLVITPSHWWRSNLTNQVLQLPHI